MPAPKISSLVLLRREMLEGVLLRAEMLFPEDGALFYSEVSNEHFIVVRFLENPQCLVNV